MRQGSFNGGSNTVSFEGLPIEVNVSKPGGEDMGKATVTVNNMKSRYYAAANYAGIQETANF